MRCTGWFSNQPRAYQGSVSHAVGAALSPGQNNLYFTMRDNDRLGRFRRDAGSGSLTFDRYWIDGSGDVNGLDGARDLAVSPDGKHLYVTGSSDNALATFNLDDSGNPTFARVLVDGSSGTGLNGAYGVALSSDGMHLYVAGNLENSLTLFDRNATTGALTERTVYRDGQSGVDGLNGAVFSALSPDGNNLYVTGFSENALAVFDRNATTGVLAERIVYRDGKSGVDGLRGAFQLVVSPDGKNVYVTGASEVALALFNRNTGTGALTFAGVFKNSDAGLREFVGPRGIAISADGKNLYVSALEGDALFGFDRNLETSVLTLYESFDLAGVGDVLDNPRGIALSSDGKTLYVTSRNGINRFSREVR